MPDPAPLHHAVVPTAEQIYACHGRSRVRVRLPQLRILLSLWCAVDPCTTKDLTVPGRPVATTVRTLRSLENKRLVHSTITPDPTTGRSATFYTLTDAGHTRISGLVAETSVTPSPDGAQEATTAQAVAAPRAPAPRSSTSVCEVLTFFEKCPNCGYPATATRMTREHDGRVEVSLHPTCGLPCGWSGPARRLRGTAEVAGPRSDRSGGPPPRRAN